MIKNNVQIQAWAPLAEGKNDLFNNEVLKSVGEKYQKSVAQVILRWLTQRGVVALAKSSHIERMKENIDVFGFTLSDEDMETIKTLNTDTSLFFSHQTAGAVDMFVQLIEKRRNQK